MSNHVMYSDLIDEQLGIPSPLADDALVLAVAKALYERSTRLVWGQLQAHWRAPYLEEARAAIEAVRDHDAGLPCGHCDPPGLDSIRCACKIGDDDE